MPEAAIGTLLTALEFNGRDGASALESVVRSTETDRFTSACDGIGASRCSFDGRRSGVKDPIGRFRIVLGFEVRSLRQRFAE